MTISGKRCTVFAAVAIIFLGIGGCKSNNKQIRANSKLRDLPYDLNAKNVAVLFGASNGLPGITDDLNMMQKILEAPETGAFQVTVVNDATRDQIVRATKDAAIAAGENGTTFSRNHRKSSFKTTNRRTSYRFFSRILKGIPTGKKTLIKLLDTEKKLRAGFRQKKHPLGGFKL